MPGDGPAAFDTSHRMRGLMRTTVTDTADTHTRNESAGARQTAVGISGITKRFGDVVAVDDISLDIADGEFFALLGPSGCGKTTTLRMIAGLEFPTEGSLTIFGQEVGTLPPNKRPVNTVFQNYALFPHLNINDNVGFGLKMRKVDKREISSRVDEALAMVRLTHMGQRRPTQLSGGQQQRIALARALVNRPKVLLLDEPLGALDLKLRQEMQSELKTLQRDLGITFVFVTHDQEEALTMSDRIAVFNEGRVRQVATPAELYEHPASTFVANFLGQSNLLRATVRGTADGGLARADVQGTELLVEAGKVPEGLSDVWVGVRPEKLTLGESGGRNRLHGRVVDASFTGVATQYLVRTPWGTDLVVVQQNDGSARARLGEDITLSWEPGREFVLDAAQDDHAGLDEDGTDG